MTKNTGNTSKKRLSTYDKHIKRQTQVRLALYIGLGLVLAILIILILLSE